MKIKQKHTKHTTMYTMIPNGTKRICEYYKRKSHISSKLHMIFISSDNVRHPVAETFTTLVDTSLPLI